MMDMQFLQSFVVVTECGSMAEAARRLDLTPAAIAARIHALEQQLGVTLLKRSGRAVKPTEAGLKILQLARSVLRDLRDLQALAADDSHLGELRLGAFVSALTSALPPVLRRLYQSYPALRVHVLPGASIDLCRRVANGELDAALVLEPQFSVAKSCRWERIAQDPLVVLAPAAMAGRDAIDLLRSEPFIRYDRATPTGQLVDRYLRNKGIWPRERIEIDGAMAIAALVDQGLGVALLPGSASLWARTASVTRIALPPPVPARPIGLLWTPDGPHAALATAVLQESRAAFAQA
jgi:DNA-binding transcriptional LysR family regulator